MSPSMILDVNISMSVSDAMMSNEKMYDKVSTVASSMGPQ